MPPAYDLDTEDEEFLEEYNKKAPYVCPRPHELASAGLVIRDQEFCYRSTVTIYLPFTSHIPILVQEEAV